MLLYGICISDIEKLNEEKAVNFLKSLSDRNMDYGDWYANYVEDVKSCDEYVEGADFTDVYPFFEWAENYEHDSYYGLSALLCDIISSLEGIDIECEDLGGIYYLGMRATAPWNFSEKTKSISKEEYTDILKKYIGYFTDESLNIRWWNEYEKD